MPGAPEQPVGAFRFCPHCGEGLQLRERGGRPRPTCPACGYVHFRNPAVGVAVVILDGPRVLLGRRSRGGYEGQWCIPCGYVEWGEEAREAARREFLEETGLQVAVEGVCAVHSNFHNPQSLTVGIWFRGTITGGHPTAGDDLDVVAYFHLGDLPQALAFPTDLLVLEQLRREVLGEGDGNRAPDQG